MRKQATIEELTILSYNALGLERSKRRKTKDAQARAAIGASMNLFFNQMGIGKALFVDRSNISHYAKNHKQNLSFWPGYKHIFDTVDCIVTEQCKNENIQDEIDGLSASIEGLTQRKNNLKRKLIR
jgi:hypothetical protein